MDEEVHKYAWHRKIGVDTDPCIGQFGGDPTKIIIFGQSAGAISSKLTIEYSGYH